METWWLCVGADWSWNYKEGNFRTLWLANDERFIYEMDVYEIDSKIHKYIDNESSI